MSHSLTWTWNQEMLAHLKRSYFWITTYPPALFWSKRWKCTGGAILWQKRRTKVAPQKLGFLWATKCKLGAQLGDISIALWLSAVIIAVYAHSRLQLLALLTLWSITMAKRSKVWLPLLCSFFQLPWRRVRLTKHPRRGFLPWSGTICSWWDIAL